MRLRFTLSALADLEDILSYIAARSPSGAAKVQGRIKALTELTMRHPGIGTPTSRPRQRRLVVTPYPYLIFYEPRQDEIIIHGIRHAARDPETLPDPDQ